MGGRVFSAVLLLALTLRSFEAPPNASLSGRVVGPSSARVEVRVRGSVQIIRSVRTNAAGQYEIAGLRPGNYDLVITAKLFSDAHVTDIRLNSGQSRFLPEVPLNMDSCPNYEGPSIYEVLRSRSGGGLAGLVLDDNDIPIAGAHVTIFSPKTKNAAVRTNREGIFRIVGLEPRRDYGLEIARKRFFTESLAKVHVESGLVKTLLPIRIERCKPGLCHPSLKQVRVLPSCA